METHSSLKTRRAGKFGINVLCKESGNDNDNNNETDALYCKTLE